ncbi:MAG: alpha-galactosidase [Clostridiales bacterium]|nr:alpha-galactosidase [Clostridiales bacterium]
MTEILVSDKLIHLRNARISYVIGILEGGIPAHLYFGKRVEKLNPASLLRAASLPGDFSFSMQNCALDHTPQEYPAFGLGEMREGALIVRQQDGTRTADLRFVSAEVIDGKPRLAGLPATFGDDCKTLCLKLHDELLALDVTLQYSIFEDCDAIARSVLFENRSEHALHLERCYSLCLDVPESRYDLITLSGAWARERELIRRPLVMGQQGVGSIRGASSLQTSPFLALARPETTEEQGEVIAMALVYSGNFTAQAYVDPNHYTRVMMGINDTDFQWTLESGAAFQTPEAVMVYSNAGLDGMSRQFHRVCADHLVRGRYAHAPRPILLNNWEATYFNFNEEKLLEIARTAARVGVELFVLDDGWFGHRDSDNSSLGDWFVDKRKLPGGLSALAEKVHALGLKFGLWFEPEMISPDSDLYRAHPDWCIHVNGRTSIQGRNQLILDLSRPDVCEYVYHAVADNLAANAIDYVKWDMNRNFSNVGSALLPAERQKELPHRYMLGLYGILERLIHDFPHVLFESCSSGGGRFDMGMLHYMPQTWTSDDTDALCRCRIQYSTSLVFPPFAMGSHVSAVPNHQTGRIAPISTRGNVAMSGCFGYELDLNRLPEEDLLAVEKQITRVKELRQTLLYGDFHRLLSPYEGNDTAWITVSPDKTQAVFMFTRAMALPGTFPPMLRLRGLDEGATYRIMETGETYGGDELMNIGLCVTLPGGDAASVSYTLKAEAKE